jgi:hypothetical protein
MFCKDPDPTVCYAQKGNLRLKIIKKLESDLDLDPLDLSSLAYIFFYLKGQCHEIFDTQVFFS